MSTLTSQLERRMIDTDGATLEVYLQGDPSNPLMVFLHGFPEYWKVWTRQIQYFVDQGYYVCAPNQRGYGHSSAPSARKHYKLDKLASDIISLITQLGKSKAILVGHDWGGGVVYHLASDYAEYVSHAIILNMPHPHIGRVYVFKRFEQFKKTLYVTLYQLPFVTSWLLKRNKFHHLQEALSKSIMGNRDLVSQLKFEQVDLWSARQKNLKGMINWYRANVMYSNKNPIDIPLLLMWGQEEEFILRELAEESIKYCSHEASRLDIIEGSIHASQIEQPEIVNSKILEFIS